MAALSTIINDLSAAAFLRPFQQDNIWMQYVDDRSAEYPGYGSVLEIPTDEGAVPSSTAYDPAATTLGVDTLPSAAEARWPTPTGQSVTSVTLEVDKAYVNSKLVNPIAERRVRPSLIASAGEWMAVRAREQVNADVRKAFDDGVPGTNNISCTAAEFRDASDSKVLDPLLDLFANQGLAADYAFWPNDGRVAVVSPRIHKYLVDKLQAEKLFLITENPQYVNEGQVMRFKGWDIVKDNSRGDGVTAADDDKHTLYFLRRGVGIGYVGELRTMRTINSENYIGMLMQLLYTYGVKVIESAKLLRTQLVIS